LKVGRPGAKEGISEKDPTLAGLLKNHGYMTAQYGKNHLGDLDEHLPTNHGFDEFFGNLYHLNAEEEPEHEDYPTSSEFAKKFGPRGVIKSSADGQIQDTGPLTRKRMETVDEEVTAGAIDFMERAVKAGKPFFLWWNSTRMHVNTHLKPESKGVTGLGIYADGMAEHDAHVGQLLDKLEELGIADNTVVMYSTDNGAEKFLWPDGGTAPFRNEKNSNWEGAYRVPAFVRWPGRFLADTTLNGLVSHEDWLPTFAAIGGDANVKQKLRDGASLNGRKYKNYIDGYNQVDYLSGKAKESPRSEFFYVNDDGQVVAIRYEDWKVVFLENRGQAFGVWREPFTELRVPLLFNLRRDPFERADENSNTSWDWLISHAYIIYLMQAVVAREIENFKKFPPRQKPASFNLDAVMRTLEDAGGGANH